MKARCLTAIALWLSAASLGWAQSGPYYGGPSYGSPYGVPYGAPLAPAPYNGPPYGAPPAAPPAAPVLRGMPGGYPVPFSFPAPAGPAPVAPGVVPAGFETPAAPLPAGPALTPRSVKAANEDAPGGPIVTLPDSLPSPDACGASGGACSVGQPIITQLLPDNILSRGDRWYFTADVLYMWEKNQGQTPRIVLPDGMTVLGTDPDDNQRTGMRFSIGRWITGNASTGLEGGFLALGERRATSTTGAIQINTTLLPFFSGIDSSNLTTSMHSRFQDWELGLRHKCVRDDHWRLDIVGGGRFLQFDEDLNMLSATTFSLNPVILSQSTVVSSDNFSTDNHFAAGYLGLDGEFQHGCFFVQGLARVSAGINQERIENLGRTGVIAPPAPLGNLVSDRGAFVGSTNSGEFHRNVFAVMPDFEVHTGVQLGCVRFGLGYNFLYLSNVVRPVSQSPPAATLPLAFLNGPFTPVDAPYTVSKTSFWAQGVSFRIEIRY